VNGSGAVLAGGRSSRFGSDKARFIWRGRTLLEHALAGLEGCAERFVIGGAYRIKSIPVYTDLEPHAGSLHGLARALAVARNERVAVTACDMPNLSGAYWEWLFDHPADIVIPENAEGFLEPLAAVYAKTCLEAVNAAIGGGNLKMTGWWNPRVGAQQPPRLVRVPWLEVRARFGADVFLNVNARADLEHGEA
jgi:molybdenum cofactor guanylyltransferase